MAQYWSNTKWDVSKWTEAQKVQWQEECAKFGYRWSQAHTPAYLNANTYTLSLNGGYFGRSDNYLNQLDRMDYKECTWVDMFPGDPDSAPHVHSYFIKLWADGHLIQVKGADDKWKDDTNPDWNTDNQYRVKPSLEHTQRICLELLGLEAKAAHLSDEIKLLREKL